MIQDLAENVPWSTNAVAPPLRCVGSRLHCTTMLRQPASATNTTISYFFSYYRGFPSGATVVFARARLP